MEFFWYPPHWAGRKWEATVCSTEIRATSTAPHRKSRKAWRRPAGAGDRPPHQHAPAQVGEAVEPLDDVVPVGVGHHHQDQDRLVPEDALEELAEERRLAPTHVEEAHQRTHEHQEVGHAEIGAGAADPLQQERAGQHDHRQQDGVGHEDPEDEEHAAEGQGQTVAPVGGHADHRGDQDHRRPGRDGPGRPAGPAVDPAATGPPVQPERMDLAHGEVGGLLIGPLIHRLQAPGDLSRGSSGRPRVSDPVGLRRLCRSRIDPTTADDRSQ